MITNSFCDFTADTYLPGHLYLKPSSTRHRQHPILDTQDGIVGEKDLDISLALERHQVSHQATTAGTSIEVSITRD